MITRHLCIFGLVQGVWYRESLREQAARFGVTGWVRNRMDGSVEAIVQGEHGAVEALIVWSRLGPERARVERVDVAEATVEIAGAERFDSFLKFPTV